MAKNRKLSAKKERRRRRRAMQRKRQESGWSSDRRQVLFKLETGGADPELLADIRNMAEQGALIDPEVLREMAWASIDLAEEPEMDGIMADPVQSLVAVIAPLYRRKSDPDEGFTDEEYRQALDDAALTIFREDEAFFEEVLAALSAMRRRFRERGRRLRAGQAALVQLMLQTGEERSRLEIGLVRALTTRSIESGQTMMKVNELIAGALDTTDASSNDADRIESAVEQAREPLAAMLAEHPELYAYLDRQTLDIRDKGINALLNQEFQLMLFSDEEVALAAQILGRHVYLDEETEVHAFADMDAFLEELDPQVGGYMEGERLRALREGVRAQIGAPHDEWYGFLTLVESDLEAAIEDPQHDVAYGFVRTALIAEAIAYFEKTVQEEKE